MTRLQSIEHFVVLMLENRSFDNLHWALPEIEGFRCEHALLASPRAKARVAKRVESC